MKVKIIVSVLNEQDEVERETVKEYRLEGITPKQAQSAERVVVYSHSKTGTKQGSFKELFRFSLVDKAL